MSQSEEVQTKVLNALYWDLAVPPHRVEVEVENGWVTISGTVDRYYQRSCAESDARRVAGVRGVNNHIRLASANAEQGATPPWRSPQPLPPVLLPRMTGKLFGIVVVVNLISTALRTQSGRRTVKNRLTEIATSWDQARPAVQDRRAKALSKERMC